MAEFVIQAQVNIPPVSGLPEDVYVNTWTGLLQATDALAAATAWGSIVRPFYTDTFSLGSLGLWLSPQVSRATNALQIPLRQVDLPSGTLGVVLTTFVGTIAAGQDESGALPSECAVVSSFHGELLSVPEHQGATNPRARRRGRIYVGPLNTFALTNDANGKPTVSGALVTTIVEAQESVSDSNAHVVWSRVEQDTHQVIGGWVDNEFDTQRRRGNEANARTTWVVS